MNLLQLADPASGTYTYVLFDPASREAVIIDPVDDQIERDLGLLRQYGLRLAWTVETHAHADHITSAGLLAVRGSAGDSCEAAEASIAWGWANTDRPRISAWTNAANNRSWGLMLRLGMVLIVLAWWWSRRPPSRRMELEQARGQP